MVISQDEEARARAMSRENSEYAMRLHERDEQAKVKVEKEEMEQKVKKSEAEKDVLEQKVEKSEADKVKRARSMVKDNLYVETIERYTGLSVEEIKRLQKQ